MTTDVHRRIWADINNGIDYSLVKHRAIDALNKNYTNQELSELLIKYSNENIIPITKIRLRHELGLIAEDFNNQSLINQINKELSKLGYLKIKITQ